jgi:DNA adenine methylase
MPKGPYNFPKEKVPQPTGYPGGKSRLVDKILAHTPPHEVYVEPFAGGAALYFAKKPVKVNVLSDIDPQPIRFYKEFSCNELQKCVKENAPTISNRRKFIEKFRDGASDTCTYFMARRLSFNSNGKDMNYKRVSKPIGQNVTSQCAATKERLSKATLLNKDFRDVVRKYDGPKTFFFMDPPYAMRAHGTYKFEDVTPKQVCDIARKARGKVLITHYDNKEVRDACKGLYMKSVPHKYTSRLRHHGKVQRVKELFIANYPLDRKSPVK